MVVGVAEGAGRPALELQDTPEGPPRSSGVSGGGEAAVGQCW